LNERLGLYELHGLRANGWVVKAMYWLLNLIDVGVTVIGLSGLVGRSRTAEARLIGMGVTVIGLSGLVGRSRTAEARLIGMGVTFIGLSGLVGRSRTSVPLATSRGIG